jgi:hypothetical protein
MATDNDIVCDDISKIPEDISLLYLPNHDTISQKAREKGLNYFTQGYVHNIRIMHDNDAVRVHARCWRSMRKSSAPHTLDLEISPSSKRITEAYCSCKAG